MKKLGYKGKVVVITFGLTLLILGTFLMLNLYLKSKNYYDKNIIEIGYTLACGGILVSFLNGYLTGKNKLLINLSLGNNRELIFKKYNKEMIVIVLIMSEICLGELAISYFVWNDLVLFSINDVIDVLFLGLLTLALGYIGFIFGLYNSSEKVIIIGFIFAACFYVSTKVISVVEFELFVYIIITVVMMILNIILYAFSKKMIMNIEF